MPAEVVGSSSLEAAARFAIAVLEANVQGEHDAKLTYTALKYLEQNVDTESRPRTLNA